MATGAELIEQIEGQIDEVQPSEANDELQNANGRAASRSSTCASSTSSRSATSPARSTCRAATSRSRIEQFVPDKDKRVIVYCASGNRSALAARTLPRGARLLPTSPRWPAGSRCGRTATTRRSSPRKLTQEQKERYSRHILVPEIGLEGQLKLLDAKVLLLGAGGLGSPTALYLAAAGVGTIGLLDDDVVDCLQPAAPGDPQHRDGSASPKTESARKRIEALNPDVNVVEHNVRFGPDNVIELLEQYDIIVDGADNFPTRYLLNDASVRLDKPVVSASILAFDGQISTFVPHEGPCYRCLYPTPPPPELAPSCGAAGVLGMLPGVMGLMQALEVFKLITGAGRSADRPPAAVRGARHRASPSSR